MSKLRAQKLNERQDLRVMGEDATKSTKCLSLGSGWFR